MFLLTVFQLVSAFIFGAVVGSFLNMAIYRTHHKKNFFGRSFCDFCKKQLKKIDLIPIISFLKNKGLSSCCNNKLPKYLPAVEFTTGLSFAAIWFLYINNYFLPYKENLVLLVYLILSLILIFIVFYDLLYFEVPYTPVILGYALFIIYALLDIYFYKTSLLNNFNNSVLGKYLIEVGNLQFKMQVLNTSYLQAVYFAIFVAIFFLFLFLITKGRGIGFGDVYTAPLLALFAGFYAGVVYLLSSFIVGALVGIFLMAIKKANKKTALPFVPFLVIGYLISLTVNYFYIMF